MRSLGQIVRFGLPEDYWDTYAQQVKRLDLAEVIDAVDEVIFPGELVWVVIGDRQEIEPALRELGLGEIRLIDTDGNPVQPAVSSAN